MLKTADLQRIVSVLKRFDCTPRETHIYLQSLESGPATVQELARQLRHNRVTVHSAVEQLIKQGFLFESRKGKRRLIAAEDPGVLYRLLQRKQNELEQTKMSIDYIANLLSNISKTDRSIPTVKFYEGVEGFKKMLDQTLESKGEVLVFTYVDLFAKLLTPKYLENYYARRAKKNISTRLIFPSAIFAKEVSKKARQWKMQIRFLPEQLNWKSGIFSWNDVVAIQSFTEGKVTCTIIENADIAFFYRKIIYELCWKQAQPVE